MLTGIKTKIYADTAYLEEMARLAPLPWIKGFTTNPTLMRKAGVKDYLFFVEKALEISLGKPLSFEVLSDNLEEMRDQALTISSWGENVYVKIPITNSEGASTTALISSLAHQGVKINVTAIFTSSQVEEVVKDLPPTPLILSIFAGRIADTGVDPKSVILKALELTKNYPQIEVLWASCREIYNLREAIEIDCPIITIPTDFLLKIPHVWGKDLTQFSLETVRMLTQDALKAGYEIRQKACV